MPDLIQRKRVLELIEAERLNEADDPNALFRSSEGRRQDEAYNRAIDDCLNAIKREGN